MMRWVRQVVRYLTLTTIVAPSVAMPQGATSVPSSIARVEVSPKSIVLTVGDSLQVTARAVDSAGKEVPATLTFATGADASGGGSQLTTAFRGVVGVVYSRESGWLRATRAGEFALTVTARVPAPPVQSNGFPNTTPRRGGVTTRVSVVVRTPPIRTVTILGDRKRSFVG